MSQIPETLTSWLVSRLAALRSIDPGTVDVRERFSHYGLDSLGAGRLIADLSEFVGRPLSPTLVWEAPSIEALVKHLTEEPETTEISAGLRREHDAGEPIAIVGMACRFPGAPDPEAFWRLLRDGVDAITEVPGDRWDAAAIFDPDSTAPGKVNTRWGGFLDQVDQFDPQFFGISPREAAQMDPQQRLTLELAWEALEDAGIPPPGLAESRTGVFVGALFTDYALLQDRAGRDAVTIHTSTGGAACIISQRVSYALGLQGPSLTLDTACSSSLVALHLACQSLRSGESDTALAGGVNLMLVPETTMGFSRLGAMSPDGRSRAFGARANGYVRSEGAGIVVLKRLSDALRAGDRIYAIVRGSAVNNDGASNGLTAPNPKAQQAVLRDACASAGLTAADIHYVEAHGTGTPLGDPIEAGGLGAVYGATRAGGQPLLIGSAKTNVGHLEAAAGIVGVIKVALAMKHDRLPPSLHFEEGNPRIDFDGLHLEVVTGLRPWPAAEGSPRRAGVSSFGYGGTNSHVILESLPPSVRPHQAVGAVTAEARRVAWVFSGQGSQWVGMGRRLVLSEPAFRAALERCDRTLAPLLGWSVFDEILRGAPRAVPERIDVMWPTLFAFQVALAGLLRSFGGAPAAVMGHSIGEVAAAHVAGALSLEDAARVIAAQAQLVQRTVGTGSMLLAAIGWEEAQSLAAASGGRLDCAIAASPVATVLAGEPAALAELGGALSSRGIFVRAVNTSAPVHGPRMAFLADELPSLLAGIQPKAAEIPIISTLTGELASGADLDVAYWARQLREPVRFAQGTARLLSEGYGLFLELSPHPIVKQSVDESIRHLGLAARAVAMLVRGDEEAHALREALDTLEAHGGLPGEPSEDRVYVLPVSGQIEAARSEAARRLADFVEHTEGLSLDALCHSATIRRAHHRARGAVVGRGKAELLDGLRALATGRDHPLVRTGLAPLGTTRSPVLVFSGQGSQWVGMGRQLLAGEPVFRATIEECDALLRRHVPWSLLDELQAPEDRSRLGETEVVQPALFAIEVGIAALLRSWGVVPAAVIGHSVGEVAAANVAGALSLEEATRLVAWRGRIMQKATGHGKMAMVALTPEEAVAAIAGREASLAIAAINDPGSVVLSGATGELEDVLATLSARGIQCRPLKVNYAFHSPQMDAHARELVEALGSVDARAAAIPIYSTVTGAAIEGTSLDAAYWGRNVRASVQFAGAVASALERGERLFLEVGPHPVLSTNVERCVAVQGEEAHVAFTLRRQRDERVALRETLGALYVHGADAVLAAVQRDGAGQVSLPAYPWQRERYWVTVPETASRGGEATGHPLLGARVPAAGTGAVFETVLGLGSHAWIGDHRVAGQVLVPATAVAELVHAAASAAWGESRVDRLVLQAPLVLPETGSRRVQVVLTETPERTAGVYSLPAESGPGGVWTLHTSAAVIAADIEAAPARLDLAAARARCLEVLDPTAIYARLSEVGLDYGPAFRGLRSLSRSRGESLAEVALPAGHKGAGYGVAPALLDAAFQAVILTVDTEGGNDLMLPFELGSFVVHQAGAEMAWAHIVVSEESRASGTVADVTLVDASGAVIAEVQALRLRRADPGALRRAKAEPAAESFYQLEWREAPLSDAPTGLPETSWVVVATAGSTAAAALAARLPQARQTDPSGLAAALADLPSASSVVCLWEAAADEDPPAAALRVATESLSVIKALGGRSSTRLWWATMGAASVASDDAPVCATAPVWGMGRTVAHEHPELGCTLVDLAPASDWSETLLLELQAGNGENQVAWRAGRRYVARLVRAAAMAVAAAPPLPAEGTVLLTGGLGALGLRVARWLAQHGVPHLVLTGRRGLGTPGAPEAVAELEALGARVTVAAVDVADRVELGAVLEAIPRELPLRGVIHAAGILDDGVLADQDAQRFAKVMAPKVTGAWNLHTLTAGQDLGLFVMFSSISGLFGAAGQSNYAAANTFLDALAAYRRAHGLAGQSLCWGPWAEGGMAAGLGAALQARFARQGMGVLSPAHGVALLGAALARPEALLGVVPLDLATLGRSFAGAVPPMWRALVRAPVARAAAAGKDGLAERLAALSPARRVDEVRAAVQADVARVLSLSAASAVPVDRPFQELGLDSLMAVELRNALGQRVGATLPTTTAFDHPTVDALTRWLLADVLTVTEAEAPKPEASAPISPDEPIAIIGMGCRYPGGVIDPESFWRLFDEGLDAISEVPRARWDIDALYDPNPEVPGKMTTRYGGFVSDVDQFDPAFFGISPREAVHMDPQQRLLLETTWEAAEQAGMAPERLMGTDTGVFVGMMYNEYATLGAGLQGMDGYVVTGSLASVASGRISYVLGLKGPSFTVDTACSSSLVTVHLACQALRQGECSLAFAGGVALMLTPSTFVEFSRLRGLAPDGRSKSFSAAADGVAWSEGCGMLLLKRLRDAKRDGDPILAVIRGSAINQDGRSNGLTAPNGPSQQAVIRQALAQAGLAPAELDYVECHGTGTSLGDPIEVQALAAALQPGRAPDRPVVIGSGKSNLGHTQAAAGAAGLMKVVLAMQHGRIPKNLHFDAPSPHIPWAELPVKVAAEAIAWPRNGVPRRAGVSSFGISGTNAHVIVEEAPATAGAERPAQASSYVLPLSAKTAGALPGLARSYAARLSSTGDDAWLSDVAYNTSVRRSHYHHRLAIVAGSREEAASALFSFAEGGAPGGVFSGQVGGTGRPRVVFVFPGQGSQWLGMGRQLLAEEPAFRSALEACSEAIAREAGFSVLEEIAADEARSRLSEIDVVQPVLFAVEVALAALWRARGVEPDAVIGHSMGEVAAAHVAGVLTVEDAAKVICRRSRLLRRVSGKGAMGLVELSLAEAEDALSGYEDRLSVAVSNGPRSTVLSGDPAALEEVLGTLEKRGVFCRRVKVDVASHSPQMDPLRDDLLLALGDLRPRAATVAMRSTVTGEAVSGPDLDAAYWVRNLRAPVLFSGVTQRLIDDDHLLFVEMSPHPILLPAVEENLREKKRDGTSLASLRRNTDERRTMLEALGALYAGGVDPDWASLFPSGGRVVSLPTYPWQRARYWVESETRGGQGWAAKTNRGGHPLLGPAFSPADRPEAHYWEQWIGAASPSYLVDHQVQGRAVFPGAGYVEMALAAADQVYGEGRFVLEAFSFEWMLALEEGQGRQVQLSLVDERGLRGSLTVASRDPETGKWVRHAHGTVCDANEDLVQLTEPPQLTQERCTTEIEGAVHYAGMAARQIYYGPAFQGVERIWVGPEEALARVRLPKAAGDASAYVVHPALLDACLQVCAALMGQGEETFVPVEIARLRVHRRSWGEAWVRATLSAAAPGANDGSAVDLTVVDDEGHLLVEIAGLQVQRLAGMPTADPFVGCAYAVAWRPKPIAASATARPPTSDAATWVVFADAGGTGAAVAEEVRARGDRCIDVVPGPRFERRGPASYAIDPSKPQDYQRLFRDVAGAEATFRGVVHCWSLDATPLEGTTTATLLADVRKGTVSTLHVVQELVWQGFRNAPRLLLVTRGAQAVGEFASELSVAQATLWGLGRTIAMEQPDLGCTRIDLDPTPGQDEAAALVHELFASDGEDQIALRNGQRLVARLERGDLEPAEPPAYDGEGTYLITGGLGGLGLAAARWLVASGARHLLLLGRSDPSDQAIEAIRAMTGAGAQVRTWRADVARAADVQDALAYLDENMPPLRGIIHAAGVLEDRTLQEMGEEQFMRAIRPKILGGWNLHAATRGIPLDFFVMYSSAAALLGPPGQGNYSAANTFLDALAHARAAEGLPGMSIQWGTFSEVGLAAAQENRGQRLAHRGIESFTPEEGTELLSRLIGRPHGEIGLLRLSVRQWVEFYPRAAAAPFLARLRKAEERAGGAKPASRFVDALRSMSPVERRPALERHVAECIGRVLSLPVERIEVTAPFRGYGMDSLMSLEIRNRLEASLGLRLSAALLFTYPTTAALVDHLLGELRLEAIAREESMDGFRSQDEGNAQELSEAVAMAVLDAKLQDLEDYLK